MLRVQGWASFLSERRAQRVPRIVKVLPEYPLGGNRKETTVPEIQLAYSVRVVQVRLQQGLREAL